jgi:GAF domain-containing protein
MEAAAGQIGLTLANAELAEQTRRQLAATRAIGEVARLGASGGLETTLDAVVTRVRELTEADAAVVFLTDPDGETFSLAAESLSEEGKVADIARAGTPSRRVGEGLVGWVIAAGEAAFVPDLRRDPRTRTLHRSIPEAAIAVPMHLSGDTVGCLRLSLLGGRQFTEPDLWLAQTLADEAALAVQHGRDLQRVGDQAREDGARSVADQTLREIGEPLRELLRQTGKVNGSPPTELRARLAAAHAAAQQIEVTTNRLQSEAHIVEQPASPLPGGAGPATAGATNEDAEP